MRSYETARSLFSFLGFCAWSVVVIGVLVALAGAEGGSRYGGAGAGLLAMAPGFGIAILGLILVAFVQMGRANVDTAEYTQQMLKIARDQLEVSRQSLNGTGQQSKGFNSVKKQVEPKLGFEKADFSTTVKQKIDEPTIEIDGFTPVTNELGFSVLNEQGTLMEYRGREFEYVEGKYNLAGQYWSSGKLLKGHLNQLKIVER